MLRSSSLSSATTQLLLLQGRKPASPCALVRAGSGSSYCISNRCVLLYKADRCTYFVWSSHQHLTLGNEASAFTDKKLGSEPRPLARAATLRPSLRGHTTALCGPTTGAGRKHPLAQPACPRRHCARELRSSSWRLLPQPPGCTGRGGVAERLQTGQSSARDAPVAPRLNPRPGRGRWVLPSLG